MMSDLRNSVSRVALATGLGMALVVAFAAGPVAAQTLEQALANAYNTNSALLTGRAQVRVVDEQLAQARSGWRPTVTVTASGGKLLTDRDKVVNDPITQTPRQGAFNITQPLYRGGRTEAATARAKKQIEAERARLAATEQQVFLDSTTAYLDVVQNTATLNLNIKNEQVLQKQLEAVSDQFRVGELTRTDVSQAQSRLAGATAARISAEGTLTTSRATFQRLVGLPPTNLSVPAAPDPLLPKDSASAAALAATDNPTVIAAQFDEGAAREQIDEVRGQLLPTLSLSGDSAYRKDVQAGVVPTTTASITAQLSVPLYEAGNVYSQVRAARQTASQRLIQVDTARRAAIEASTRAYETLVSARASNVSLEAQIRAAEIALEGVRQESRVGSRTIIEVLNAEQELLNAQVALVRSQHDDLVAAFTILNAIGRLNARTLAVPVEIYDVETNYNDVTSRWFGTDVLKQ